MSNPNALRILEGLGPPVQIGLTVGVPGHLTRCVGLSSVRAEGVRVRDMAGQRQEGVVASGDGGVGHARGRGVRAREVGVDVPSGHLLPVFVSDGGIPDVH